MKLFYILLNMFLFILAILLLAFNLTFKPHPPDKILSMAPDLGKAVPSPQKIKSDREEISDIAGLWENNLFSPYRSGEGGSLLAGAKPTGMELLGICIFGDVSGATILDKQPVSAIPLPGRARTANRTPGSTALQATPTFYKLGSTLSNGFILTEVNSNSVVLSRGREQIVLEIAYEDEGTVPPPLPPVALVSPPVPEAPTPAAEIVPTADTSSAAVTPVTPARPDSKIPVAVAPGGTAAQPVSRWRGPPAPRPDQ